MSSLNKVMLIGHCADKPESKVTASGKTLAKIRIATNSFWRDEDGEHKSTEWHDVVAWEKLGEQCVEYLHKGRQVFIEGRLRTSSWKNEQGEDRSRKEIVAHTVKFLGPNTASAADPFAG